MAQIDNFIGMMVKKNVDRAVLRVDKPAQMMVGGKEASGPAVPGAQLQKLIQEITPDDQKEKLGGDQPVQFSYSSPHGDFDISIAGQDADVEVALISQGGGKPAKSRAEAVLPDEISNVKPDDKVSRTGTVPPPPSSASDTGAAPEPKKKEKEPEAEETAEPAKPKKDIDHIDELFHLMEKLEASDLHLSSNEVPMMRVQGIMRKLDDYVVNDPAELQKTLFAIAPERNQEEWESDKDTDFAYEVPGLARFRCNFFADRHGIGGVFRLIPSKVLTVKELGLPRAMIELCNLSKGLVVVTGPTGSGKSTTLAALVDHINKERDEHVITIEDPVEFVHENINCLINQREVHVHTQSFTRALRAALREDPDICLVGEMRDLETVQIAITTAETGHLVFGTLHTTTAPSTVDRIIDQFPADEQAQIRVMLSETLKGVIAQTLLRTIDGKRVAAHEILLVPTSVANLIREGKTFQLTSQMQIGKAQGMITMNDSIIKHVVSGRVAPLEGYIKATDKVGIIQAYEANDISIDFETAEHLE